MVRYVETDLVVRVRGLDTTQIPTVHGVKTVTLHTS